MQTVMSYQELPPTNDMAHIVLSFWELSIFEEAPDPLIHEVFPDGCVNLVCRKRAGELPLSLIVGPRLAALRTVLKPGDYFVGARLSPAAASLVLSGDPAGIFNQNLPARFVLPAIAIQLEEGFGAVDELSKGRDVIETVLSRLNIREDQVDEVVAVTSQLIEGSFGQERIADIAAAVRLSTRQLERRFRSVSGFTPKQFARLRRMYAATYAVARETSTSWAERAAEIGYSDQAHLTREFVNLTGRSPAALARDLSRIKYGVFAN